MGFPGGQHCPVSQPVARGIKCTLCSHWKRTLKPSLFRTASHIPLSFADYNYMWSAVGPLSESSNVAVVFAIPDIFLYPPPLQSAVVHTYPCRLILESHELQNCPFDLFNWANRLVIFSEVFSRAKINSHTSWGMPMRQPSISKSCLCLNNKYVSPKSC